MGFLAHGGDAGVPHAVDWLGGEPASALLGPGEGLAVGGTLGLDVPVGLGVSAGLDVADGLGVAGQAVSGTADDPDYAADRQRTANNDSDDGENTANYANTDCGE